MDSLLLIFGLLCSCVFMACYISDRNTNIENSLNINERLDDIEARLEALEDER